MTVTGAICTLKNMAEVWIILYKYWKEYVMKLTKRYITNPVAKAMLEQRKQPQVVPPKKGTKRKPSKKEKYNALRDAKLY